MPISPKLTERLKPLLKTSFIIYPLIIILAIPLLIAFNTFWNLRSFNRDVNFVIRHQAISTADTLKPFIKQSLSNEDELNLMLHTAVQSNSDLISATILKLENNNFDILATTDVDEAQEAVALDINHFATGLKQPVAGLTHDVNIDKNVWNVVVPLDAEETTTILAIKLKTETVDEILGRTSRDSIIVLVVLIIITIALLVNHFFFYRKALKAQQLAELDRLKDEFISMAAHELRTPMTALTGYLDLLKDKVSPQNIPGISEYMVILEGLTKDLHNLIDDLLEVSRIEQGRLKVEIKETQVNDVVSKVVTNLTPIANQKGLKIKFTQSELPITSTDPERIHQVVTNIVGNSVKYTLKGEVTITALVKGKFIEVVVADTGIGIPADELPNLFTKFHRVKDKQTKDVRGTGLGLWITKQIIEALGGKIYTQSIYGTGTSVTFTIPIRSAK